MKILLIKPLVNKMKGSFGQLMLEPPLGLMYLSAFLKEHGYRDIKIIHMDAQRMDLDGLSREMETYRPDIVGISALSDESPGMFQAADRAKQYRKDCLVVAGGPHPSGDPLGTMEDRNIDLVVSGEGEQALLGIVQAYQGDRQYHLISNVYSRKANVVSSPDKVTYIQDIDSLPFPDWDAVDMASYAPFQHMSSYLYGQKYMPLFTSRGCPFQCIFCHNIFGKVFRAHSAQRVFDEIKTLHDKHGIKHFSFFDDIFNCDRQRVV
ncbi:MAG: B12-binding domain-containing radical SAM protein, partial [Candidatus Omnitrophica bacterium]|nr:B12-binding domain-containing radical SAM protein [Candidatus Omnitrophota bacterium]